MSTDQRIHSIDRLRGIVIMIMALDHVRDYFAMATFSPEDLSQSSSAWFLTRWITHFCAPVFVFLSGMSAWLHANAKGLSTAQLSRFLLSRGLWLIFLELTLISASWQFGYGFLILQVIWAIGWSMVILAGLIFLPRRAIGLIGAAMIIGHNSLDGFTLATPLWTVAHTQGFVPFRFGPLSGAFVAYPLIPWIGVMTIGYWAGPIAMTDSHNRHRAFVVAGASMIVGFVVLRLAGIYGDPGAGPADAVITDHGRGTWVGVLSFFNTTKYPPSLQYLLMTLGPALAAMPMLERWSGRTAQIATVFGRVPFLFYVLHIPFIHVLSRVWGRLQYSTSDFDIFNGQFPPGYEPSLLRCYTVWAIVLFALYWPCRAFMHYRREHNQWWLSYV